MLRSFIDDDLRTGVSITLLKEDNLIPRVFMLLLRSSLGHSTHRSFSLRIVFSWFILFRRRDFGLWYLFFGWLFLFIVFFLGLFFFQKLVNFVDIVLYHILIFFIHLL